MSEDYLRALEDALRAERVPGRLRSRLLAEVEDHLSCDPEAPMGPPEELASRVARDLPRRTLPPALLLLGAVIAYVLPLYAIPENTLPPAPAEGLPQHLHLLTDLALWTFLGALAAAVVAVLISRIRPWAMVASVLALLASGGFAAAATAQWPTERALTVALAIPAGTAVLVVAAASVAWAAWPSRSRRSSISPT